MDAKPKQSFVPQGILVGKCSLFCDHSRPANTRSDSDEEGEPIRSYAVSTATDALIALNRVLRLQVEEPIRDVDAVGRARSLLEK